MMQELGTFGSASSLKRTRDDITDSSDLRCSVTITQDITPAQELKLQDSSSMRVSKDDVVVVEAPQKLETNRTSDNNLKRPSSSILPCGLPSPVFYLSFSQ